MSSAIIPSRYKLSRGKIPIPMTCLIRRQRLGVGPTTFLTEPPRSNHRRPGAVTDEFFPNSYVSSAWLDISFLVTSPITRNDKKKWGAKTRPPFSTTDLKSYPFLFLWLGDGNGLRPHTHWSGLSGRTKIVAHLLPACRPSLAITSDQMPALSQSADRAGKLLRRTLTSAFDDLLHHIGACRSVSRLARNISFYFLIASGVTSFLCRTNLGSEPPMCHGGSLVSRFENRRCGATKSLSHLISPTTVRSCRRHGCQLSTEPRWRAGGASLARVAYPACAPTLRLHLHAVAGLIASGSPS